MTGEGDQRGGGAKWEPIKILYEKNSTYISKSNRRASLLTPSRPHSYQEVIALKIGLGTTAKTQIDTSKNTYEIDDKNRIKEYFIFSQALHQTPCGRVQKTAD
jgi:hypothetical protein